METGTNTEDNQVPQMFWQKSSVIVFMRSFAVTLSLFTFLIIFTFLVDGICTCFARNNPASNIFSTTVTGSILACFLFTVAVKDVRAYAIRKGWAVTCVFFAVGLLSLLYAGQDGRYFMLDLPLMLGLFLIMFASGMLSIQWSECLVRERRIRYLVQLVVFCFLVMATPIFVYEHLPKYY